MSVFYRVAPAGQAKARSKAIRQPNDPPSSVNPFAIRPEASIEQIAKSYNITLRDLFTPSKSPLWILPQTAAKQFLSSAVQDAGCAANPRSCPWSPPSPSGTNVLDGKTGTFGWGPASSLWFDGDPKWLEAAQGFIPNCHFIATLQSLSITMPHVLRSRITPYGIRVYNGVQDVVYRVDSSVPVFRPETGSPRIVGATAARSPFDRGIVGRGLGWAGVVEKAFAAAGVGTTSMPSYLLANFWVPSPDPEIVSVSPTTALTGQPMNKVEGLSISDLLRLLRSMVFANGVANTPAHLGTVGSSDAFESRGLVPSHAYSFCGLIPRDGRNYVVLRNAWGTFGATGPGTIEGDFLGTRLGTEGVFALELSEVRAFFPTLVRMGG